MGTRNLIILYHNGRIVVAQYGGHDSHPSHTGREIMSSLSSPRYIQRLRANLHLIRYRESESHGDYVDDDIGICILDAIAYVREPVPHSFGLEFASDGTFCEWTYVVGLDAEVLEVYEGVSDHAISRMRERPVMRGRLAEVGVRQQSLRMTIPFIDLPGDKEELVKACTAGEEEEEEEGWW
jgi:hypothetical protein